ncbi:MAG: sigma-70 family RNA polymerase sigma factor [Bacilli bacterium]
MSYNKAREEKKWKKWKYEEEELMHQYGVPDYIILELRNYDWAQFNSERRFLQRQFTNNDCLSYGIETYEISIPITNINNMLDYHIESEELFLLLSSMQDKTLDIIFYKFCGYSNREISKITHLSESAISKRIGIVRKKIKKVMDKGNY